MATRRSGRPGFEVLAAELKKGTLHPAYLLWGEESFLVTRAVQQIVELALEGATDDPFNLSRFSAPERGLGPALATSQELPMLRNRRVVIVEGLTSRDGYGFAKLQIRKPERDRLRAYLESPSPSSVLVMTGRVADYKQKSILDLPATLQALESLNIPVIGYQTSNFPRFHCLGEDVSANLKR